VTHAVPKQGLGEEATVYSCVIQATQTKLSTVTGDISRLYSHSLQTTMTQFNHQRYG